MVLFVVLARPMHPFKCQSLCIQYFKGKQPFFCRKGPPNQIISGTTPCRQTICLYRTINCRHDNSLNFLNMHHDDVFGAMPILLPLLQYMINIEDSSTLEAASSQLKISNPPSVFTTAEVFTGVTNFRVNPSQHMNV